MKNFFRFICILIPSKENFILVRMSMRFLLFSMQVTKVRSSYLSFLPHLEFGPVGSTKVTTPYGFNSHVYVNGFIMIHSYLTRISLFAAFYKPWTCRKVHHLLAILAHQYLVCSIQAHLIMLVFLLMMGTHNRLWIILAVLLLVYTITLANEYCNEKPWACCSGDSSIKPGKVCFS